MLINCSISLSTRLLVTLIFISQLFSFELYAQSNKAVDSLKNVLLTMPDDTAKVRTYTQLIKKLFGIRYYNEGLQAARQSLVLSQQLQFKKGIADAYNNIGLMYENLENKDSALANYFISLKTRGADGDKKQMANTYNNIANAHNDKGNYIDALKFHFLSLRIKEEVNDSVGMGISYNNIGLVYKAQSNYQEALLYFTKSLTFSTALNDKRGMAMTYNNLSSTFTQLKDYDKSIFYIEKATVLNKASGNKNWLGRNYNNTGNLYKLKANEFKINGDTLSAALYVSKAIAVFNSALAIFKPNENNEDIILVYNNIGEIYIDEDRLIEAENYFDKVIGLVENVDNKKLQLNTYKFSTRLYHKLAQQQYANDSLKVNWFKKSLLYLEKSNSIKDSLYNESNSKQIAEIKTKYETEKKDNAIVLLNKEKDVQKLSLAQQHAALLLSQLESEKNISEIALLNKNKEVQELTLNNTQQKLSQKELEAKTQTAEIQLMQQNKLINESELAQQKFLRNGLLAGLILLMVVGVLLYNRFQLRKKIEYQQVVLNERKRISNELHDDLGSGLSTIRFLSEVAKAQAKDANSKNQLEKISDVSNDLVDNMRQIVWTMNAEENTLENLIQDLKKYVNDYLDTNNLSLQLQVPETFPNRKLSSESRRNIFLVVKECLHNTVKHAEATEVTLTVAANEKVRIVLKDNGKGFNIEERKNKGNGLISVSNRMQASNGTFQIENKIGITITLTF